MFIQNSFYSIFVLGNFFYSVFFGNSRFYFSFGRFLTFLSAFLFFISLLFFKIIFHNFLLSALLFPIRIRIHHPPLSGPCFTDTPRQLIQTAYRVSNLICILYGEGIIHLYIVIISAFGSAHEDPPLPRPFLTFCSRPMPSCDFPLALAFSR